MPAETYPLFIVRFSSDSWGLCQADGTPVSVRGLGSVSTRREVLDEIHRRIENHPEDGYTYPGRQIDGDTFWAWRDRARETA